MISCLALATGCRTDVPIPPGKGEGVTLSVKVNIPAVRTRADIGEGMIEELWVMVFGQTGTYLARYKGVLTSGTLDQYTFSGIPISDDGDGNPRARTLHFVANYDFSGFNDIDYIGDHESDVLPELSVGNGTIAYWQRVVLEDGIRGDSGETIGLPNEIGTVHLLRNVAQISVVDETGTTGMRLENVTFAVGNRFDTGSVAPYNHLTAEWGGATVVEGTKLVSADDFVMEALDGVVINTISGGDLTTANKQVYERNNSANAAYVIVKGDYYESTADSTPATAYYKINLVDDEDGVMLDIQRNWKYTIKLKTVSHGGFSDLNTAMTGSASNGINAETVVSSYPSISDGHNVLEVEATSFVYTEGGVDFSIWYRHTTYDALGVGTVDNVLDDAVFNQQSDRPVVNGTVTAQNGVITGRLAATPSQVNNATITISKGNLSRTIHLQLRPVMTISAHSDPANGVIATTVGTNADIHFSFPANTSESLFPIQVLIYSKKLTPPTDSNDNLSIQSGDGEIWYVYNAEAQYVDGVFDPDAEYILDFVSNSTSTNEFVRLEANRFNDAYVKFGNPQYNFVSAAFDPAIVERTTGAPVDLTFTIPGNWWTTNSALIVTFSTTGLQPLAGNPSSLTTVNANTYRLTVNRPATPGNSRHTVRFQTMNTVAAISATLSASGFENRVASVSRPNWNFLNTMIVNPTDITQSRKPRSIASTSSSDAYRMRVMFSLPEDLRNTGTYNITFVAPRMELLTGSTYTSTGLTSVAENGTNDARTITMTVNTANNTGPFYFTVYNGLSSNTSVMTLTAPSFNVSNNLNSTNYTFSEARFRSAADDADLRPRNVNNTGTSFRFYFQLPANYINENPGPVTLTFISPSLILQPDNRSAALVNNITVNDGNTGINNNRRMTITIDNPTTERYYFTVRISSTSNTYDQATMYFHTLNFNQTANLN